MLNLGLKIDMVKLNKTDIKQKVKFHYIFLRKSLAKSVKIGYTIIWLKNE